MIKEWTFSKHFLSCLVSFIFLGMLGRILLPDHKYAFSVGIMGGIDQPTGFFITSKLLTNFLLEAVLLLLFIMALFLFKPIKNLIESKS